MPTRAPRRETVMQYPHLGMTECTECGKALTEKQIAEDDSHCPDCIAWLNGE